MAGQPVKGRSDINSKAAVVAVDVRIYVEDMLVAVSDVDSKNGVFDESMTAQHYRLLKTEYNPRFVTTMPEKIEEFTSKLKAHWKDVFDGEVSELSIDQLMSLIKKPLVKIIMSDELFFKQSSALRSELLSSGSLIVFASLFTNNLQWTGIDNKVPTGRGASNILSKLQYSHIPDRKLIGLFIESKYFKPSMTHLFEDNEDISFVPAFFHEVPSVEFDFLFQRVNQYRSKMLMKGDEQAAKIFENYMKYEEKCKDCVFIDRYDCAKVMMYRSEFMDVLKEICESENERLGEQIFHIPWTRGGDYLDMLNNETDDPSIRKICKNIPYPLISKSDLACGDKSTHSFLIISEKPEDWRALKESILKQYYGKPFVLQSFFEDDRNIVIKAMFFMGEFTYDIRQGIKRMDDMPDGGEFVEQSTKSLLKKKKKEVIVENLNDSPLLEGSPNDQVSSRKSSLSFKSLSDSGKEALTNPEFIAKIQEYTENLADKMRLHMVGIDFLVDTSKDPYQILPIDLNKMPRPDNIPGFREKLINLCYRNSRRGSAQSMKKQHLQ